MSARDDLDAQAQLAALREEARRLGFDDVDHTPVPLESADDFIARMKAQENPQSNAAFFTRHRRQLLTALVAAAAVFVAVAVVFRPSSSPVVADTPPVLDYEFSSAVRIAYAPGEPAEPALTLLTEAALDAPTPAGGPVQHHVSDNWFSDQDDSGGSVITPRIMETWLRPNGSLLTKSATGRQLTSDGRGIPSDAPNYSTEPTSEELPANSVDAGFPASLSTDPEVLRGQLLEHSNCPSKTTPNTERSLCLYDEIRALFTTYVVQPDLAAALWQTLEGEEGFRSLGSVEDRAGRNGLGISLIADERPQYRFVLIASTDDGQLLGTEEILIKSAPDLDVEPPAVISFTTITTAERVRSAPPQP